MDYGAIAQLAANALGTAQAQGATDAQLALLKKQLADQAGIPLPQLEQVIAQQRGPSAMQGIQTDQGLRSKQNESLGALQDIIDSGGMTLDEKTAEEAANSSNDAADRRRRAGITSEMQQRGQLDSGADLVAKEMSAQDAANRGRQSGQESAARAQARKLQALQDMGQQAGQLRSEDFGEAAQKAQAQDSIDAWNAGSREKAGYYNAGLPQQQFGNQMARVTGQAGAAGNLAAAYGNQAALTRGQYAGYGQGLNQVVNGGTSSGGSTQPSTYSWTDPNEQKDANGERGGYQDISEDDEK